MFRKKKLAFSNKTVFEKFSPSIDKCFCVTSRLMFEGRINIDGSVNMEQAGYLRKYQLWSYIYYLYYYNNTSVETFSTMMDPENGKASAIRFYEVVKAVIKNQFIPEDSIIPLDVNSLIYFINVMIHTYGQNMKNPITDYIHAILNSNKGLVKIDKLTVKTGNEDKVVLTTDDKEDDANIRVKLNYN